MVPSETGTGGGTLLCAMWREGMFSNQSLMAKVNSVACFLTLESAHPRMTIITINLLCNLKQELHQNWCVLEKVSYWLSTFPALGP